MKQNILILMCDQLRYDALSINGNKTVSTPNMDSIAINGVTFDNAYSSCPVCVPARYGIMSGCLPDKTNVYSNFFPSNTSVEQNCGGYLPRLMKNAGYRTFGIGKFHTIPMKEDLGFDVHLHSEEIWSNPKQKFEDDDYCKFLYSHKEYAHVEQPHGERSDMYYVPQTRAFPQKVCVENWLTENAVKEIEKSTQPFLGFLSFIAPHPPFAPPVPYNRMFDPDKMDAPSLGDKKIDFLDAQIPFMNRIIWADNINTYQAKALKARYYAQIKYIDDCIGRILESLKKSGKADNTLIILTSDHGDHLGDHNAWQKESFFEQSAKIPFLLSSPALKENCIRNNMLVSLTDLLSTCAGSDMRDGIDLVQNLNNGSERAHLFSFYGEPGTSKFKAMVRKDEYKYIFCANGNIHMLFDLKNDPGETVLANGSRPTILNDMKALLIDKCKNSSGLKPALGENGFLSFDYSIPEKPSRILQFDTATGVKNFIV